MPPRLSREQLLNAAEQFGTPLYVYHADAIRHQYARLVNAFTGADVRFFYAAKALTNINILSLVRAMGCGIDCSSANELALAREAGFAEGSLLYTSSNVSFQEIEEAVQAGAYINIDSLSNLRKFGEKFAKVRPVGVRLRPNIMAGGNMKISTGHADSKFGVPIENILDVIAIMKDTGLRIRTLHIHTGSEIRDVEVFAQGIEVLLQAARHFPDLEVIDLGGGFKVPYREGEEGTNIELLAKKVKQEFEDYEKRHGRHFQVWFEPGKFLVSEAGYFLTTVNVLKQGGATRFAGVNSGLNHFIRPMFYGAWHDMENLSNPGAEPLHYHVVGNICETDTFAENRLLAEIREGDVLSFRNAGAYCFEMSSWYNSRFRPAEVLFHENEFRLIRKRDRMEDLLRNQQRIF
jgi:diaminopimelate decarboxylase